MQDLMRDIPEFNEMQLLNHHQITRYEKLSSFKERERKYSDESSPPPGISFSSHSPSKNKYTLSLAAYGESEDEDLLETVEEVSLPSSVFGLTSP